MVQGQENVESIYLEFSTAALSGKLYLQFVSNHDQLYSPSVDGNGVADVLYTSLIFGVSCLLVQYHQASETWLPASLVSEDALLSGCSESV